MKQPITLKEKWERAHSAWERAYDNQHNNERYMSKQAYAAYSAWRDEENDG